jgi:hypothetical protein
VSALIDGFLVLSLLHFARCVTRLLAATTELRSLIERAERWGIQ